MRGMHSDSDMPQAQAKPAPLHLVSKISELGEVASQHRNDPFHAAYHPETVETWDTGVHLDPGLLPHVFLSCCHHAQG